MGYHVVECSSLFPPAALLKPTTLEISADSTMSHYKTTEQVKGAFGANPRRALIITTVKHESRAVRSHLLDRETISDSKGTLYDLGRFPEPAGDWVIVQAFCQAGNNDAAVIVTKAVADFGGFNVIMFVGVAGSLKEDVPIGSVVAGNFVYNSHSGKEADTVFQSRPHGYPAASELIQAANSLILDDSWIYLIKSPLPTELPPVAEYPCTYPPEAAIKSIASGELVIAGGMAPHYRTIRERLNDAAAVEMEGYGTMTAAHQESTPAIIVRGISDMCAGKTHQSDLLNQPIAAAHAAAFAFGILSIRSKMSPLHPNEMTVPLESVHPRRLPEHRLDYVLNFSGQTSDWVEAEIMHVVNELRRITGDPGLTLVRVDEGSVRIVVSVREKDLPALTLEAVKAALGEEAGKLLGVITTQEITEADKAKEALKRSSANLLSWDRVLPGGGWLERPEKQSIEGRFQSESSSTVVLGEPGSGKSALLAAIATDLIHSGGSVLAIKADLVSTAVHSELDLQADLQLSALPSELIEQLALLQPVFLLIDQLDALASQLDLQSDRLNVLLNLVRRVGGLPNVHIVLSARTFEFNHDVRLRSVDAESTWLALPAWHKVEERLSAAGVDTASWPESAREVVRNPQALKTYLSISDVDGDQAFSKYQSMLEQLWRQKIGTAPDSEALALLASDLAGIMAEEETLWLAASRFDTKAPVLERLESIGLIVRSDDSKSIAFSHQTLFDFVLARSFVRVAGRLSSYVIERQNSLFVRAKLWSALHYLRDAEIVSYEREFLKIWQHQGLRRHLRLLLIEFLGQVHDPVPFEEACLINEMQSTDLRIPSLKSIIGNSGWFSCVIHHELPVAMVGNDPEVNLALRILQRAWSFAPDAVVRLLREQWLPQPEKDGLTWEALNTCMTWTKEVEEIAHTVLSRTAIAPWSIDHSASVVIVEQPKIAFGLIRSQFDLLLEKARATHTGKPYPSDATHEAKIAWHITDKPEKPFTSILESLEWVSLPAMAEAAPKAFLEVLWPWFRSIFEELRGNLHQEEFEYSFPGLFSIDINLDDESSRSLALERPILSSLRLAIEGVALTDSEYFLSWAEESGTLALMMPQRLIAYGFSRVPEKYAQYALSWLSDDLRRFQLGNPSHLRQTTAALISTVSPYWTDEQIHNLESKILQYRPILQAHAPEPQQRTNFNRFIRATKTHLLASLPYARLSETSRKLIAEEKRALGEDLDRGITHYGARFIGSPMEVASMMKAKDCDILNIFREIPDDTTWNHPSDWMRGGNIQLSRAFAEFAKSDPARAFRIMKQFDLGAQERAAGYALNSLAELGDHDKELLEVLLDFHQRGFSDEEFKGAAAHAVEKIANRSVTIDESVVKVLTLWLSTTHMEPPEISDEQNVPEVIENDAHEVKDSQQHSVLWGLGGATILPGGNFPILSALASILLKSEEGRDQLFDILNDQLEREWNPKVWQALLMRLSNAGGSKPDVVSKFLRVLFARYPALLETHEAVYFLAFAQRWDDSLVLDLILNWDQSKNPMLRQAQGELVGLISIVKSSEPWIRIRNQLLESGSTEAKIGLAYAGANLWPQAEFHSVAGSLLTRLVTGADRARMLAILDMFRICGELVSNPTTLTFLRALAKADVSLVGASTTFVVEKLQSLLPHAAEIIGDIALKLVDAWRSDLSHVLTGAAIAAPQLTDLAITLHRMGGHSRETGVTVFEALIDLDAYGVRDTLVEIDGRFSAHQVGARRRITRRASRRL